MRYVFVAFADPRGMEREEERRRGGGGEGEGEGRGREREREREREGERERKRERSTVVCWLVSLSVDWEVRKVPGSIPIPLVGFF